MLGHLCDRAAEVGCSDFVIVARDERVLPALRALAERNEHDVTVELANGFLPGVAQLEASDRVLLIDPRHWPTAGFDFAMIDTLTKNRAKASESKILDEMGLTPKQYGVITLHRPSNVDDKENLSSILDAFDEIGRDMKLVFPMHPRTRKNIESMNWSAMRTLRGANDFIHTSC